MDDGVSPIADGGITPLDVGPRDGGPLDAGPVDVEPPRVLSTTPAQGAVEVFERRVTIRFSEPMNQASLEAAIPRGSDFAWMDGGATVTLAYDFPFDSTDSLHSITLGPAVRDLAGNGLAAPFSLTVTMASRISMTLDYDADRTGNCTDPCTTNFSFFEFGDSSDGLRYYGGITFALDVLPSFGSILGLDSAAYRSQVISTQGNPGSVAMGGFLVDHVVFSGRSTIDDATVLADDFGRLSRTGVTPGAPVSIDVTDELRLSWSSVDDFFQLRFEPVSLTPDGVGDEVRLRRGADENGSIVAAGVADPDASNRSRVEIFYFD